MKPENKIYGIMLSVLAGEATQEEQERFNAWLSESEENKKAYSQVERLYRLSIPSESEKVSTDYDVDRAWESVKGRTINKRKRLVFRKWFSYAAMLALLLAGGIFYTYKQQLPSPLSCQVDMEQLKNPILLLDNGETVVLDKDTFSMESGCAVIYKKANLLSYVSQSKGTKAECRNRLIIPKGEAYELKLSDGTHIWLNSESELIYPTDFTSDTREVTLKGEAFFDVAKDKSRPFIVVNNKMKVEVLGTSFNVSGYVADKQQNVTLVEGSVQVQVNDGAAFRISPSEQFSYDKETHLADIHPVDTDLYTAWTEGKYIFRDASLEDIFSKLQHWYDFKVVYQREDLKDKHFSIEVSRGDDLKNILDGISFTSDVKLVKENNIIYVNI